MGFLGVFFLISTVLNLIFDSTASITQDTSTSFRTEVVEPQDVFPGFSKDVSSKRKARESQPEESKDRENPDDFDGFAVFVDSPDESDEVGNQEDDSTGKSKDSYVEEDDDEGGETKMKHVISDKFQNGSVVHDIRIAVKHPQNMKGKKKTKDTRKKTGSQENSSISATSASTPETPINLESQVTSHGEVNNVNTNQTYRQLLAGDPTLNETIDHQNENSTQISLSPRFDETTSVLCSQLLNLSEADLEIGPTSSPRSSSSCNNNIFLNLTDSHNYVGECILSCIKSKMNEMESSTDKSAVSSTDSYLDNVTAAGSGNKHVTAAGSGNKHVATAGSGNEHVTAASSGNEHVTAASSGNEHVTAAGSGNKRVTAAGYGNQNSHNSMTSTYSFRSNTTRSNSENKGDTTLKLNNVNEKLNFNGPIDLSVENSYDTSDATSFPQDICLTDKCIIRAADILKRMDPSVDPCVNFYEFSCGGYFKTEIPNDYTHWSVVLDADSEIVSKLSYVLRQPVNESEPNHVVAMKYFFARCTEKSPKTLYLEILQEFGGWPSPNDPTWKIPNSNWQDIAFNWTYGSSIEYNFVELTLQDDNITGEVTLSLRPPSLVLRCTETTDILERTKEMLKRVTNSVASVVGVDFKILLSSIGTQLLFFDYAVRYANESKANQKDSYYTLGQLKKLLPHLNLVQKLQYVLEPSVYIDDDEVINVFDVSYLLKIDTLMRDTPVRTQNALLALSTLQTLLAELYDVADSSRYWRCVRLGWDLYPNIMGHIYTTHFIDDSMSEGVLSVIMKVKSRFEKTLLQSSLENEVKLKSLQKLNSLKFIVGNEWDREFDRISLDGVQNLSLVSMMKRGLFDYKRSAFSLIHKDLNSSIIKFMRKYVPYYRYQLNGFVLVPLSEYVMIPVLHQSFYDDDLPFYVNFGGIGVLAGHEMVHAVVLEGSLNSSSRYRQEERCLVDQFNGATERYLQKHLNGSFTVSENVADLGGFRDAYFAYMEWNRYNSGKEMKLPGLHRFDNRQMFWLSAATNWCKVSSREGMVNFMNDEHAPWENRINEQYSNFPEFSRDFNCPLDSPMNPREKCSLW